MIEANEKELRRQANELKLTVLNRKSMKYAGEVLNRLIDEVMAPPKPAVKPASKVALKK